MIEVLGKQIGDERPPFIIAEMSGNHNNSLRPPQLPEWEG
jgi:sialic acid synthase SpsE